MVSDPYCRSVQAYQIKVLGCIDGSWSGWFDGLTIDIEYAPDGSAITTLSGHITDQAALRGVLVKLWDLNLPLLSVRLLPTTTVNY